MVNSENVERLEERLAEVTELIKSYSPGTDEYDACKEEIKTLANILNDDHKLELERQRQTYDSLKDTAEEKERKVDRGIKLALGIGGFLVSIATLVVNRNALKMAFAFETNGTFRSKAALESFRRATTNKV